VSNSIDVAFILKFRAVVMFFSDIKLESLAVRYLATAECSYIRQAWSVSVYDANARD
jgi:hypothetical protein